MKCGNCKKKLPKAEYYPDLCNECLPLWQKGYEAGQHRERIYFQDNLEVLKSLVKQIAERHKPKVK